MKKMSLLLVAALVATLATGCQKKVQLTIYNHTDSPKTVQLTVPDGTQTLGTVGPDGGYMTSKLVVKVSDLPAQARLSADGAATSFTVMDDSPGTWWFHIEPGKIAGPMQRQDMYTPPAVLDADIKVKSEPRMIVR